MKKIARYIAVLLGCIMLFALFTACTPEIPNPGPVDPDEPIEPVDPDEPIEPVDPIDPEEPDEPDGPQLAPAYPYDAEEAKAYDYKATVTAEMPAIRINTEDGSNEWATKYNRQSKLNGEIEYATATISVDNCEEDYKMDNIAGNVKVRGNYTLEYEKKPIRIKFDKKQPMLGLHDGEKYKNWVLLADWKDLSASQNSVAFYLGQTILGSDGYYSSDFRTVEVYLNNQYWGVYLLVEQQEVKSDRMSVSEVEDDYTGTDIGYLFEYDGYYTDERNMEDGDPTFEVNYTNGGRLTTLSGGTVTAGIRGYTVKSDIYDDAQLNFIKNYTQNVYRIAYEAAYNNRYMKFNDAYTSLVTTAEYKSAQEAISAVIDVQSLVDMYILQEIACDPDIGWSSFYIGVDMSESGSKKLIFEAPWDFDSSFGIKSGFVNSAEGMFAANCGNPWLVLLIRQQWFQEMVKEKWVKLNAYGAIKGSLELVQTQKEVYQKYYEKNLQRWSNRVLYGNGELIDEINSYRTQGEAADYLYNWLYKRYNYLSAQWSDGRDVLTGMVEAPVSEELPENATPYRFEAENAELGNGVDASAIRTGREGVSNGGYVGDLAGGAGRTVTFRINCPSATKVYLFAGLAKRSFSGNFNDWFTVTVNGVSVKIPKREITAAAGNEQEWHTFVSVKLAPCKLAAGENVITFTTGENSTNFDYLEIYSAVKLG